METTEDLNAQPRVSPGFSRQGGSVPRQGGWVTQQGARFLIHRNLCLVTIGQRLDFFPMGGAGAPKPNRGAVAPCTPLMSPPAQTRVFVLSRYSKWRNTFPMRASMFGSGSQPSESKEHLGVAEFHLFHSSKLFDPAGQGHTTSVSACHSSPIRLDHLN